MAHMNSFLQRRSTALGALLLVTIIWGLTFVWMEGALDAAAKYLGPESIIATIGLFLTVRFGIAAIILLVTVPSSRTGFTSRASWKAGAILGALLLGGFLLQMVGLSDSQVTASVSAFLTSLYVVFTAIIWTIARRSWPSTSLVLGVLLTTIGAGFINGPPHLNFNLPEWLTVGCGLLFAGHIIATDVITRARPPMEVTLTGFLWVTFGALGVFVYGLLSSGADITGPILLMVQDPQFVLPTLYCSVLGSFVAITLLNQYQRVLSPVRAAILFAIEPVWAATFAISVGQESITVWLIIGGAALLCGNLVADLGAVNKEKAS
jgi:drug/metabolite transporter (DMT)-like permease